ncbi:MAG: UDP-N-acetylmuramoyl-L-alanyl-D-glutamate--2,6-diaminopimelate ligase, partial [Phycisphaerae bacterium]
AYDLIGRRLDAPMTTPAPLALAAHLAEARRHGARAVVMEVSSHSLSQRRVAGIPFRVAVFTNLSGDHLDYHGTMQAYAAAKKRLFDSLAAAGTAVVNADDPSSSCMLSDCPARVLRYGLVEEAEVRGRVAALSADGSEIDVTFGASRCRLRTPLLGRHNVMNVLAAIGAGLSLGLDLAAACRGVSSVKQVRGRLEPVETGTLGFALVVDYAHTDDALKNALGALRPVTKGRLWCVFGCGGDRDRSKRPRMAQAAEAQADRIVVTSDNPRGEDPSDIIGDIRAGFSEAGLARCHFDADRARAIAWAIGQADRNDTVLIAGKGHEGYQIVGARRLHFDDVEIAAAAVARRGEPIAGVASEV